ncbi:MAG: hypothetical protein HS100_08040 [Anaerolineales bacterium]|nr:hypothetical protein [Anaerolineales bacterium]
MKRLFFTALVLTALLAMTAGTAFAGSALELRSVGNNQGGPTFVFRVTGEFSNSELTGFVQVQGGDDFPLYCSQTSPTEVVCHASKKVGGHDVVVGFGGARFWTYVPEPGPGRSFCYPVYDWLGLPDTVNLWVQFETACQESPANPSTTYVTYNPYVMAPDWTYYYYDNAPGAFLDTIDPGPGFYPY